MDWETVQHLAGAVVQVHKTKDHFHFFGTPVRTVSILSDP